jgi:L-galactose dehydrogenase
MEQRTLGRTGLSISVLGFGAAPLGNEYGNMETAEGERAVHAAIAAGVNFFDTSPYYGRTLSEERLGNALRGRRERVVLSTKCGRYDFASFDFSATRVTASVDESLRRLRTDFVDILIAHDIEFGDVNQVITETIPRMRELQKQGKTRSIGISGLPVKLLRRVALAAKVDLVLSYCHYNLMVRDLDTELAPDLEENSIGLINASALHMGMLTREGPPPWHPAPQQVKNAARQVVALCERKGVDPAVTGLSFALQHRYISSTLVGISNTAQLNENLRALSTKPDPALLKEIDDLIAPVRDRSWSSGRPENYE